MKENLFLSNHDFLLASAIFHFLKKETVEDFLTRPPIIKAIGLVLILISLLGFRSANDLSLKVAELVFLHLEFGD